MINEQVLRDFETNTQGPEILGMTTRQMLKGITDDILKYSGSIHALYDLPIEEADKREELGRYRTSKHNVVIGDMNKLRRACALLSLGDPFCDEELTERHDYAVTAFDLVSWFLKNN